MVATECSFEMRGTVVRVIKQCTLDRVRIVMFCVTLRVILSCIKVAAIACA